jgi:lantibiotic biosynthesis protein
MEMLLEKSKVVCLDQIAECLSLPQNSLTTFGYSNGLLGKALFFAYYSAFTEDDKYGEWSGKIITTAIKKVIEPYEGKNLYKELSELGIFLEYAKENNLLNIDTNQILLGADKMMHEFLEGAMEKEDFDPYTGALMCGSYFLGRSRTKPEYAHTLEKITIWLGQIAHQDQDGNIYWVSKLFKKDNIYLGMSHGLASIMVFLCRVYEMGIQQKLVRKLLVGTAHYILSKELDFEEEGYHFPNIVDEKGVTSLGLCYGDMGTAYALLRAGMILEEENLTSKAISIFRNCASRQEFSQAGIKDAGILYGASGVALMFDKVYEMTQIHEFFDIATYWYENIADFDTHSNLTAGFSGFFNQHFKHTNIAFMEGIAGIGCTLIKYSDRENYNFDELIWLN